MSSEIVRSNERNKCHECWMWIKALIPVLEWLPNYSWKQNILPDLSAGMTMACVNVPQSLAFSVLARVPLMYGMYTACFSSFVYTLLGTAVVSSFGPVAVGSMLTGVAVSEHTAGEKEYSVETFVATMTFTIGLFYIVLYLLQFGVIAAIFRKPFVSGFIAGCTLHILVNNAKMLFGLTLKSTDGIFGLYHTAVSLATRLPETHIPTLIISIVVLIIFALNIFVLKKIVAHFTKFIVPMEAIVLAASIAVSFAYRFDTYGVPVVGDLPKGLPRVILPDFSIMLDTLIPSLTVGVINYATTISMTLAFNKQLRPNQESLAMGVANVVCCNFQCITIGNSMTRTVVAVNLGIKSLLATMTSSFILLFVIIWGGPIFYYLPVSVLGCIIVASTVQLLIKNIITFPSFFKSSFENGCIWMSSFLVTTIFEIKAGLIIGIVLSLRQILREVVSRENVDKIVAEPLAVAESERLLEETAAKRKESTLGGQEII